MHHEALPALRSDRTNHSEAIYPSSPRIRAIRHHSFPCPVSRNRGISCSSQRWRRIVNEEIATSHRILGEGQIFMTKSTLTPQEDGLSALDCDGEVVCGDVEVDGPSFIVSNHGSDSKPGLRCARAKASTTFEVFFSRDVACRSNTTSDGYLGRRADRDMKRQEHGEFRYCCDSVVVHARGTSSKSKREDNDATTATWGLSM